MTDEEKYLFDLRGFLVIEGVLSEDEIKVANESIDGRNGDINIRMGESSLSGESTAMKRSFGRGDLGGMLFWDHPECDLFRKMLVHPTIVPYLNEIITPGFRLDHGPSLITMDKGAEGHVLHGASGSGFDPNQYYVFQDGRFYNGLTVVSWQLADSNPGDGGVAVVPGSHKANISAPKSLRLYEDYQEHVLQVTAKAGDVIIFTEALTHGTLPWEADHQRRSVLYKYSPANLAYSKGYNSVLSSYDFTPEEKSVLERPYHPRAQNRPVLDDSASLLPPKS